MLIISFRTLIIFLFLSFFMRLLGKRQVGQLEIGEFISALLLSELAAFPISDPDVPLLHALLPIGLIVCLEIFISCLCARFPFIKKVFDGCPAVLIRKGQVDPSALSKARISPDELLAQLRLKGCADPSKVDYALLEQNGQFSVVLKSESQPLSAKALRTAERSKTMVQFIQTHYAEELTTAEIARSAAVSESECLRCFRATIGISPIRYLRQFRVQKAMELLDGTAMKVAEVGARCGFSDNSYFTKVFHELKGCSPSEWRERKKGSYND